MKNVEISHQHLLSYQEIYGEKEIDVQLQLVDIPIKPALEVISFALHNFNLRKKTDIRFHSDQLFSWMMQMEEAEKSKIVNFAQRENQLISTAEFQFIDRQSCLNLIQHILVHCKGTDDKLEAKDHSSLFKCLIYFNANIIEDQEKLFNWNKTGTALEFMNYILPIHFKNIELTNHKDYKTQFLKAYYFSVFCEQDTEYASYLSNFLLALNLKNYSSYLWRIFDTTYKLISSNEITPKIQIDGDDFYLQFYDRLVVNENILWVNPDFLEIRTYPMFKLATKQYLFLDYRLFVDKLYQSFIFDFARQSDLSVPALKSYLGDNFSEHFLFYKVMDNCFSRYGKIRLTGEQLKSKLIESEPDYYIREGSKVFIFEFKDLLIASNVKQSKDTEKIKLAIIDKLEKTKSGQSKGIKQLLNSIISFKSGLYTDKMIDEIDPTKAMVYPILVHTDITLESYGTNYFLKQRFETLLDSSDLPKHQIKNVTLINLDTLIQLQDYFKSGILKLSSCINDYIDYTANKDAVSANFPFDEFLKHYLVKKTNQNIAPPKDLLDIMSTFEGNSRYG